MTRHFFTARSLLALAISASVHLVAQTPSTPAAGPTYSRDVAPILYKNCTACHRPGEIGPMSLLTYKDARPWAKSIAARIEAGTMPPWSNRVTPEPQNSLKHWRLSQSRSVWKVRLGEVQ